MSLEKYKFQNKTEKFEFPKLIWIIDSVTEKNFQKYSGKKKLSDKKIVILKTGLHCVVVMY